MARRLIRGRLTRSSEAGEFLEIFLIGAAVSALGVRWLLALTGYPRVGGGGLHVAHVLWGGLLMLAAIIALLLFLDRRVQQGAAGIAGIGFGVFIDEIGKFLTADSDYFFRPAIALIYVIFVGLFLLLRVVLSAPNLDSRESLANAMDLLQDGLDGTIEEGARAHATLLLRQSAGSALTQSLEGFAAGLADRPPPFDWARRATRRLDAWYDAAVENPLFERAVVLAVGVYAAGSVSRSDGSSPARELVCSTRRPGRRRSRRWPEVSSWCVGFPIWPSRALPPTAGSDGVCWSGF